MRRRVQIVARLRKSILSELVGAVRTRRDPHDLRGRVNDDGRHSCGGLPQDRWTANGVWTSKAILEGRLERGESDSAAIPHEVTSDTSVPIERVGARE